MAITSSTIGAATMALTAPCPDTLHDHIPGLVYSPEWHREQDDEERAWLDDYARAQTFVTAA